MYIHLLDKLSISKHSYYNMRELQANEQTLNSLLGAWENKDK